MIVADTNLIAYLLIEGERTATARQVYGRNSDWRVPSLWRSEFLSVLATSVRARVLEREQAFEFWRRATTLLSRSECEVDGEDVLRTALRWGISAYDAHFVAAAELLSVPLVTCDRRLVEACAPVARAADGFTG